MSASNENRHGFRNPYAQISGSALSVSTNGLSAGTVYGRSPDGVGSMRRIFPSNVPSDCPLPPGAWPDPSSPAAPPSPSAM